MTVGISRKGNVSDGDRRAMSRHRRVLRDAIVPPHNGYDSSRFYCGGFLGGEPPRAFGWRGYVACRFYCGGFLDYARNGIVFVCFATGRDFKATCEKRPCDLTRGFSMLREANEVIGARQYYRYGEFRLSEV